MIPKVSRGDSARGLVSYLAGPGNANEHTQQRVVASNVPGVDIGPLPVDDRQALGEIADLFDAPWISRGTPVTGGHVWHCSLSLRPPEQLDDERWAMVAQDFLREAGITTGDAPVRWLAVHHGQSAEGNDHVHLAVNLVREDGTTVDVWRDYSRAQRAALAVEQRHGLEVLQSRLVGAGGPAYTQAEAQRAQREGQPVARQVLERHVRAAAAAATDERQFVELLREQGVRVRPRISGGDVGGYAVALDQPDALWFGGGKLGADLTLPQLRREWAPTASPAERQQTSNAWRSAGADEPLVRRNSAKAQPVGVADIEQLTDQIRAAQPGSQFAVDAAHDVAGALSAASLLTERVPGELAEQARRVARTVQRKSPAARRPPTAGKAVAMVLLQAVHAGDELGHVLMLRALLAAAHAVMDLHRAQGPVQGGTRGSAVQTMMRDDGIDEGMEAWLSTGVTVAAALVQRWAELAKHGGPEKDYVLVTEANAAMDGTGRELSPEQQAELRGAFARHLRETEWADATRGLSGPELEYIAVNKVLSDPDALASPERMEEAFGALWRLRDSRLGDLTGGPELLAAHEARLRGETPKIDPDQGVRLDAPHVASSVAVGAEQMLAEQADKADRMPGQVPDPSIPWVEPDKVGRDPEAWRQEPTTAKQEKYLRDLHVALGKPVPEQFPARQGEASQEIQALLAETKRQQRRVDPAARSHRNGIGQDARGVRPQVRKAGGYRPGHGVPETQQQGNRQSRGR